MGHQDKGHYAAKHSGRKINQTISKRIRALGKNDCLTCAAAHKVGKELNMAPSEIGIQTDLIEFRISECQLGLFGYSDGKKRIDPNIEIIPELNDHLEDLSSDGRISCRQCWDIAKKLKIKRLDVGSACEKKNIRIKPCQIGAF